MGIRPWRGGEVIDPDARCKAAHEELLPDLSEQGQGEGLPDSSLFRPAVRREALRKEELEDLTHKISCLGPEAPPAVNHKGYELPA